MQQTLRLELQPLSTGEMRYLDVVSQLDGEIRTFYAYYAGNQAEVIDAAGQQTYYPTSLVPTAFSVLTINSRKHLAIAAQNAQFQAFVLIYDFENRLLVTQFPLKNTTSCITQLQESQLLVAYKDYIYCYRVAPSKTTDSFREEFWTMAADDVTYILQMDKQFVCFCEDMYLRLYDAENLLDEVRAFPRSKVMSVQSFNRYILVMLQNGKSKLFTVYDGQIRLLCQVDDLNHICGKFVHSVHLISKPFSYPLQYYLNTADLQPFYQNYIEKEMKLEMPVPLLLVFFKDSGHAILMFDLLKNDKFQLSFKPEILIIGDRLSQHADLTSSAFSIRQADLYASFMRSYSQTFLDTEELPFAADSVAQGCKQVFALVVSRNELVYLEMVITFDFGEFIELIIDAGGEIGARAGKRRKRLATELDETVDKTGLSRKKIKRTKKPKKKEAPNEQKQLCELFRMRSLVLDKTIYTQFSETQISDVDFAAIAKTCIENVQLSPGYDGFEVKCAAQGYQITSAVLQIDNQRYSFFGGPKDNQAICHTDSGLSRIFTDGESVEPKCQESLSDYQAKSQAWRQKFHCQTGNRRNNLIPAIVSQSLNEMIITYQFGQYNLNLKSEIETSILPYLRIKSVDNAPGVSYPDDQFSSAIFQESGIEQILQFLQCCFIDYDFAIPSGNYYKINEVLVDSRKENMVIEGCDFLDFFSHVGKEELFQVLKQSKLANPERVHIFFSRNTKEFRVYSLNLKSVLTISQVIQRVLKMEQPQILVGLFYKRLLDHTKERIAGVKAQYAQSNSSIAELTQGLAFASDEVVEKCYQKLLTGVLSGYDTVVLRSLQEIQARTANFEALGRIKKSLEEVESLMAFFDKELASQFDFGAL